MSLADEIEAGGGTDEAVALTFGWEKRVVLCSYWDDDDRERIEYEDERWVSPAGDIMGRNFRSKLWLTDLNALWAECERRDYSVRLLISPDGITQALVGDNIGCGDTPSRALCAALIRAVESEARDAG